MSTCPDCRLPLTLVEDRCSNCGVALTGPIATQLWETDQQIAALVARRGELLEQLRPRQVARSAPVAPPWSAQRILLGLGVLLVVTASLVFVAVSWRTLGVAGQVTVVGGGAVAAAAVSRRLERRRLLASAEATAVLGVGLIVVGAAAARSLGLLGLGLVDATGYASVAAAVVAVLCALAGLGSALHTWPVTAVLAAAVAPLLGVAAADAGTLPTVLVLAGVALGFWLLSFAPAALSGLRGPAQVAAHGYLVGTWAVGLLAVVAGEPPRLAATGVALLASAAVIGWCGRAGRVLEPRRAALVWLSALAAAAEVAAGSYTLPAPGAAVVVVVAAAAVAVLTWPPGSPRSFWPRVTALVAAAATAGGSLLLLPRLEGRTAPGSEWAGLLDASGAWLPTLVAFAAIATASGLVAARQLRWRGRAGGYAAACAVVVVWVAAATGSTTGLVVALAAAALAVGAVTSFSTVAELALGTVAVAAWLSALGVAVLGSESLRPAALVLAAGGVAALAYGFRLRREWLWYTGAAVSSAGRWLLLLDDEVRRVEAYSLPLAGLCLLAGVFGRVRRPDASSWAVAGPALAAALLPSAVASVGDADVVRPLVVLAVAGVVLVLGVWRKWQAPVVVGATAIVIVAVSQLAPYAVGAPRWVSLGALGAVLLALGVRYEARRRNAESAIRWVRDLH